MAISTSMSYTEYIRQFPTYLPWDHSPVFMSLLHTRRCTFLSSSTISKVGTAPIFGRNQTTPFLLSWVRSSMYGTSPPNPRYQNWLCVRWSLPSSWVGYLKVRKTLVAHSTHFYKVTSPFFRNTMVSPLLIKKWHHTRSLLTFFVGKSITIH